MKKVCFASDHAGFKYKQILMDLLIAEGYEVKDFGVYVEESCDYPDFAHPLAQAIENETYDFGIAFCGSGNGINMTVNKYQKVRGALCWNTDIAKLARLHNNANICAIPARFVSMEEAKEIMINFLDTGFEGGRHQQRIDKISIK